MAPLRRALVLAGLLQVATTALQLTPYVLLVELARRLLLGQPAADLLPLGVVALAVLAVGTALGAGLLLWLHLVDASFATALRIRLLDKLSRLPLGWFSARGSTGVKSLVQDDTLALHYVVTHAVPDAVAAVAAPVLVLTYLFAVDWRLGLVLLVPILAYAVTMGIMVVQSGPKIGASQRWAKRMGASADGYLEGQPVVRTFGGAAASAFTTRLEGYLAFLNEWQRPFTGKKVAMDLITRPTTFGLLIAAVGTPLVINGSLPAIDLLPFLVLGTSFGGRLLGIGYGLAGLRSGLQAAGRLGAALDTAELAVAEPATAEPATAGSDPGTVDFDQVSFGYTPATTVIDRLTLRLEPGTVTALVGPSGSGKSTLAALVARFHDVSSGAIRIGGDDIRTLPSEELYQRVGFVLQDVALVRGTVAENIALAKPGATREQIVAAATAAQIHQRIQQLPQGYETMLPDAVVLSGGERQRLTIARAILANTSVLVLDEATAFADPESEWEVQRALDRLRADKTVLVIAHRLHTIVGADQIVVLENGRILERGRHAELLAAGGRYRDLWEAGRAAVSV